MPWKPAVSILRLYKSSRRLPSRLRYSSFNPSDTESSCSWSGTVSFWESVSTLRSSIQKRGLTLRSEVTGSGVVVDVDLGEGVTLFGVQPVLRAAASLIKLIFSFLFFNFQKYFYFIYLNGTNPCANIPKSLDWWIEKTDPDFWNGTGFVKFKITVLFFFNKLN